MTTPSSTLQHYEVIADIAHRMLRQARDSQWNTVIELSHDYIQAVEHLKTIHELSDSEREERRQLLTQILNDDAQVRLLATPELKRLGYLMGDMKRQHNVVQAYCAPSLNA